MELSLVRGNQPLVHPVGPGGEGAGGGGGCGADGSVLPHGLRSVHRHQWRTGVRLGREHAALPHDLER